LSRKKQVQKNIEIKPDMKILLELEQTDGTGGVIRITAGSYIEEITADDCVLIKMPVHNRYYCALPQGKPIPAYLFTRSRMYSGTMQFLERVVRSNLIYAKMRKLSDIKANQRRDCFRLKCDLPVSAERLPVNEDEKLPPIQGQIMNLSDGGAAFLTNETVTAGEILVITFDIGTVETVEAKVLISEQAEAAKLKFSVSVRFIHKCRQQKSRIYKYIMAQQLEILRKAATENELSPV